jgi:hypothetical protein
MISTGAELMHVASEPGILYFGAPVVLISTTDEDGSYNLAPMSSAFWLGWRCLLGLAGTSKTTQNIMRTGECVLNLPSRRQCRRSESSRPHDGVKSGSGGKGAPGLQIHTIAAGAPRHCEFRTIALTVIPGLSPACPGHPRRSTPRPVRIRSRSAGHLPAARTPNRVDGRA